MKRRLAVRRMAAITASSVALALGLSGCGAVDESSQVVAVSPSNTAANSSDSQARTADKQKPRTKAVPAPSAGNIREKLKNQKRGSVKRASIGVEASLPEGVKVRVSKVTAFTAKAETPGEVTGPAVAVTIVLKNASKETISVDSAMVSLTEKSGDPAQPTTSDPYAPFAGDVAPGAKQAATYVFLIAKKDRKDVKITVEYLAGNTVADFSGNAS